MIGIPQGNFRLNNTGAGTYPFSLNSNKYTISVMGAGFGTVTWNVIGGDGVTAVPLMPSFTANGFATIDLPAGDYNIVVATATGVYVNVDGHS